MAATMLQRFKNERRETLKGVIAERDSDSEGNFIRERELEQDERQPGK
jgi:hypothetical protein